MKVQEKEQNKLRHMHGKETQKVNTQKEQSTYRNQTKIA